MEWLWVGVAYGLGWLANRVGWPPLVGYLGAGFVLWALGHSSSEFLGTLADIGVLLLLFTVGLKLRLASLLRREVLGVGGLHLLLFALLAGLLALGVGFSGEAAWFLGIGLAFSSTVLAVKLLDDRSELATFHGRIAVGILVLQDLVAVGLMAYAGVKNPTPWALLLLALPLLRPLVVFLLERSGHDELLLLYGLGLALGGARLAQALGVSPELGALLMGMTLAAHPKTSELSRTLWGLKEAFLVAFFLKIGLMGLPTADQLLRVLGLLSLLPLKAGLFFFLFIAFGLRARTAFVTSISLASYSEFALIASVEAVEGNLLPASFTQTVSLVVALSLALAAPLNRGVHRLYQRYEPFLLRFERKGHHADDEPTSLGGAEWLVVGMGRTGGAAYKMLEKQGHTVLGLDADEGKLEAHRAKRRNVRYGDAEDPELWERLDLTGLKGVLLTLPDLEAKLRAAEGLKRRGFKGIVAATSYHREEDPELRAAGVTLISRPFAEAGERLAERAMGLNPLEAEEAEEKEEERR
ncbi:potassium transporter KefC [Meiothermus sp. QL-1]|uniref:cation:proton antiporter family protein n=1 Tax=Meiothermus sp. QL-1 TaxID=2058095 RepID=UPI000E0BC31E|nr:cation:proton antiporter family protein [Meiothermus sp. QL-1]RDI94838.1 potassium transporter KefC [Meiothermus sp. QL-1]